ncbi:limonene-1,2-epoxide hydrolase family protein [Flavisphingomonas formosensis]|uniref:limonene-1,2-epoxide hydrolase family protein n=1 Tax=Flavisphingomonas formosensis TaxID=861534 RepID=UPI0012F82AC6|nr:limonene-1,2-epoxide hydrolase family protein [Sphingomonas formosensis]
MSQACDEVLRFFGEWSSIEAMIESIRRRFTQDTVWDNVGFAKTVGPDEAVAFMDMFVRQAKVTGGYVVTHHIAAAGSIVLTERTDIFHDAAGKEVIRIPLMGIFEMDGPRVLAWRDYSDVAAVSAHLAAL